MVRLNGRKLCNLFFPALLVAVSIGCLPPAAAPAKRTAPPGVREGDRDEAAGDGVSPSGSQHVGNYRPDPQNLAPYLLRHDEAEQLKRPYFLEQRAMTEGEKTQYSSSDKLKEYETFIEGFIEQTVKLPQFSPGRTVDVIVVDESEVNAGMDGWQQLVVNSGIIALANADGLLATLCHELAHSARNHHLNRIENPEYRKTLEGPVIDDIGTYWEETYDSSTKTYTHKKSRYLQVATAYSQLANGAALVGKRTESEADILGAMICAQLGMPLKTYISGLEQVIGDDSPEKNKSYQANSLEDGLKLEVDNESDFLWYYLFAFSDHPATPERLAQLRRLSDLLEPELKKAKLHQSWSQNFSKLKRSVPTGVSLSDQPRTKVVARSKDGNVVVKIEKPIH